VTPRKLGSALPTLVLDTNVLLLLIGYECSRLEALGDLDRRRVLEEIRGRGDRVSPERFDDLWRLFQSATQRIVTQHVIAEAYGLRSKLGAFRSRKSLVWRAALEILRSPGIEEDSFQVRQLSDLPEYRKILTEIGPADTGLLFTAERRKATILTEDRELWHWATVRNIPVLALNQIGLTL
jgi:rRNA-processing protein FCF1